MDERVSAGFRERARELGLDRLTDADLVELERGWRGLGPQLQRLREGLTRTDRPQRPTT